MLSCIEMLFIDLIVIKIHSRHSDPNVIAFLVRLSSFNSNYNSSKNTSSSYNRQNLQQQSQVLDQKAVSHQVHQLNMETFNSYNVTHFKDVTYWGFQPFANSDILTASCQIRFWLLSTKNIKVLSNNY